MNLPVCLLEDLTHAEINHVLEENLIEGAIQKRNIKEVNIN